MIEELHVTNLALIRDARLAPSAGLTVLTGETGAGKSALLSAMNLIVGDRAAQDRVRDGSDALSVEVLMFSPTIAQNHPDGLVVSRRVSSEGRSKCQIDGAMATVAQLGEVMGPLIDLCGQHEHQKLLRTTSHRSILDSWAGDSVKTALEAYAAAWEHRKECLEELERVESAQALDASRIDDARFVIARVEEVNPGRNEYEELEATLPKLEHADALARASREAYEYLMGDGGALDDMSAAVSAIEEVSSYDARLENIAKAIEEVRWPLEDAARELRRYSDDVDFDPQALEEAEERMGKLVQLMRLFGPGMPQVFEKLDSARELVELVDDSHVLVSRARERLEHAENDLVKCAASLSEARTKAAPELSNAVTSVMQRLEMSGASLMVSVTPLERPEWGPNGADHVEFMYLPGSQMTPRPFARIASGGEVSRVMLAIKTALGAQDDVETLIFDEIDAGVGGSSARAVASVIEELSKTHQVIVVTHLAQIASRADTHYLVRKTEPAQGDMPETVIERVDGDARVREIARMLAGDTGKSSLELAREMMLERTDG